MEKGRKQLNSQMNPAGQGEWTTNNDLFAAGVPVWYEKSGKVNPEWLSSCEEERNRTVIAVTHFEETAVHVSTYGGVRGRQR